MYTAQRAYSKARRELVYVFSRPCRTTTLDTSKPIKSRRHVNCRSIRTDVRKEYCTLCLSCDMDVQISAEYTHRMNEYVSLDFTVRASILAIEKKNL